MADQYIRKVMEQSKNLNSLMKLKVFKDELFPPNIKTIGKLTKDEEDNNLNPMKNLTPLLKKRVLANSKKHADTKSYEIDVSRPDYPNQLHFKRIQENFQEVHLIKNDPKISDDLINNVIQGHLGNCYYLSAITSLAEFKSNIKFIFQNHYDKNSNDFTFNKNGLISVIVYINGKQVNMLLDDYFPFVQIKGEDGNDLEWVLGLSILDGNSKNFWPILLEKAWAKANGNYGNIIKGNIPQAFYFISPSPVDIYKNSDYYPEKIEEIYQILKKADDKKYIVCADISNDISNDLKILTSHMGLLRNHAYSILSIWDLVMRDGDQIRLLKIRNPWGNLEWNGDWSDNSALWTDEFKKKVGYSDGDDGCFFIDFLDFLKFFSTTYICNNHEEFKYTFKKISNKEKDSFFTFKLELPANIDNNGFLIVNLKSTKIRRNLLKNENFENCNVSLFLFEEINISGNKFEYNYIESIVSNNDRISLELPQGNIKKFVILIRINHDIDPKGFLYNGANSFFSEKTKEIYGFKIGLYSHLEEKDYKLEKILNQEEFLRNVFTQSFKKNIEKLPEGITSYFYEEDEKETYRILHFDNQKTAMGIFVYHNYSNAIIQEKILFENLNNISLVPILQENLHTKSFTDNIDIKKNSNELDIEENVFDDDNENEFLKCFKDSENSDVDNIVNNNSKIINQIDKKGKEFLLKIPAKSKFYGLLIKNSEDTDFEISSNISLKYLMSAIWQEKQFETKKTKLKYKDTSIPIIETFIKYNNGLVIKYKNKSNEFIAEVKIKLENVKNTKISNENIHIFNKIYGDEEAESIIKIEDDNNCIIIVHPGEIAFVEITSKDPFEDMNYDVNLNYNIYTI